ncbi:MAG: AAA family ATPase [Pseudobdellovibrionaceae bacterium]
MNNSFFLLGPRQTGKSTLLLNHFRKSLYIDLLKTEVRTELAIRPQKLREICRGQSSSEFIIIDEVQKVPELLNEVHFLIESEKRKFILAGSSARGLKKAQSNMRGGQAWMKTLHPLYRAIYQRSLDF